MVDQIDMDDIKRVQTQAIHDEGLIAFEKYIGRIEWLHPEITTTLSKSKYCVIDVTQNKVMYESDKMTDMAKEFCVSASHVSKCYTAKKLIHDRYLIVRCGQ